MNVNKAVCAKFQLFGSSNFWPNPAEEQRDGQLANTVIVILILNSGRHLDIRPEYLVSSALERAVNNKTIIWFKA